MLHTEMSYWYSGNKRWMSDVTPLPGVTCELTFNCTRQLMQRLRVLTYYAECATRAHNSWLYDVIIVAISLSFRLCGLFETKRSTIIKRRTLFVSNIDHLQETFDNEGLFLSLPRSLLPTAQRCGRSVRASRWNATSVHTDKSKFARLSATFPCGELSCACAAHAVQRCTRRDWDR